MIQLFGTVTTCGATVVTPATFHGPAKIRKFGAQKQGVTRGVTYAHPVPQNRNSCSRSRRSVGLNPIEMVNCWAKPLGM